MHESNIMGLLIIRRQVHSSWTAERLVCVCMRVSVHACVRVCERALEYVYVLCV